MYAVWRKITTPRSRTKLRRLWYRVPPKARSLAKFGGAVAGLWVVGRIVYGAAAWCVAAVGFERLVLSLLLVVGVLMLASFWALVYVAAKLDDDADWWKKPQGGE